MTYNFFDSLDGDRKYRAADWAKYFAQFIGNGVYANPATAMQVRANGGMQVCIAPGACFINGYQGYADGSDILTLEYGGTNPRIDRIVIRLDLSQRSIYPAVIEGTAASSPTAPDIIRNGTFYDLGIADITIAKNAAEITQSAISDTRYGTLCGIVEGLIQQIDTTDFFTQWQTALNEFIESLGSDDHIDINVADSKARSGLLAGNLGRPISSHLYFL